MTKSVVNVEQFGKTMTSMLKDYTDDVVNALTEETIATSNDGCEILQETKQPDVSKSGSAKPMTRRKWNRYAKSWSVKQTNGNGYIRCIIHNKKYYRLTHLLEYGHATRNGTYTRAFRHIEPIELYCENRLLKNIPKIIEKGGKL